MLISYEHIGKIKTYIYQQLTQNLFLFYIRTVRKSPYASLVEIPLPRSDRLAALPLPNPILRRAVSPLSQFLRLLISSMAESRGPAGVPVGSDSVVDDVPDKTGWAGVGGGAGRRLPPARPPLTLEGSRGGGATPCKARGLRFCVSKMSVHRVALFIDYNLAILDDYGKETTHVTGQDLG